MKKNQTPKYRFFELDNIEPKYYQPAVTKDPQADFLTNFMLGYVTNDKGQGISDFLANFPQEFQPDSFLASVLFPTQKPTLASRYVVTIPMRELFYQNYFLRDIQKTLSDFAFATLGLMRDEDKVYIHQDTNHDKVAWLNHDDAGQRGLLLRMATSFYLLGNLELASSLCDIAILSLSVADLESETSSFLKIKQKSENTLAILSKQGRRYH